MSAAVEWELVKRASIEAGWGSLAEAGLRAKGDALARDVARLERENAELREALESDRELVVDRCRDLTAAATAARLPPDVQWGDIADGVRAALANARRDALLEAVAEGEMWVGRNMFTDADEVGTFLNRLRALAGDAP